MGNLGTPARSGGYRLPFLLSHFHVNKIKSENFSIHSTKRYGDIGIGDFIGLHRLQCFQNFFFRKRLSTEKGFLQGLRASMSLVGFRVLAPPFRLSFLSSPP
ncbi:hypothetical protein Salat_2582100 [Sesamum alatum]|uniref:Uncharacterized protein n=1 Tax=Sesamum alatum TaxID=300844 RepID=A0AAE2CA96_9LAMI|nr:hypothetical protein Salat_2582100 [Sesamum alatum]